MLYQTQERALAPGVVVDWPAVIKHPTSPHGRLLRVGKLSFKTLLEACCGRCEDYHCGTCARKPIKAAIERAIEKERQ